MKIGDIVGRKSHNKDILFRINKINSNGSYELCGIKYRLKVTTDIDDLTPINIDELDIYARNYTNDIDKMINKILSDRYLENHNSSVIPGTVLHIDADKYYLDLCMKYYKKLMIKAVGEFVDEENQPIVIKELLEKHRPDILVITGHDSMKKTDNIKDINSYSNSKYFIETVKIAREINYSKDSLVIIAGACQSYYEELIKAGANISSSPKRIVIHALDPLLVAEKIAYGKIGDILDIKEILENTLSGIDGMGGVETRGILREVSPKLYNQL